MMLWWESTLCGRILIVLCVVSLLSIPLAKTNHMILRLGKQASGEQHFLVLLPTFVSRYSSACGVRTPWSGVEVEKMHRCTECEDVVTNPVCDSCLHREFGTWLNETSPYLSKRFNEDTMNYSTSDYYAESCILCGQPLEICPFCTTKNFVSWLRTMGADKSLVNKARRTFSASPDRRFL